MPHFNIHLKLNLKFFRNSTCIIMYSKIKRTQRFDISVDNIQTRNEEPILDYLWLEFLIRTAREKWVGLFD